MRDLYKRIGISAQTDSLSEIENAMSSRSSADAASMRAARHILLDPERKAVYDRTHSAMRRIGQLRANLGLSRSPNGLATDCSDFEVSPTSTIPELHSFRSRHRNTQPNKWGEAGARGAIVTVVVVGLLAVFVIEIFINDRPSSQTVTTPKGRPPVDLLAPPSKMKPTGATRADTVRSLVIKRMERVGLAPDAATINAAVQKLLHGQAEPTPANGVIKRNFYGQGDAPLEVKTTFGSYYYLKVIDWNSKAEVLTAFIRGGHPFETAVPVGSYEIKYAAGQKWFGPILDFGEGATYSRCDDRFDFEETATGYSGFTIELIMQRDGNLETDPISADDF